MSSSPGATATSRRVRTTRAVARELELERVNGAFELAVELVSYSKSTSKNRTSGAYSSPAAWNRSKNDGQGCDCGPPKLTGAYSAASPKERVRPEPLVVVGSSGSRDVIYPIPGGGLLEGRPPVPGGRERTDRERKSIVKLRAMQLKGQL